MQNKALVYDENVKLFVDSVPMTFGEWLRFRLQDARLSNAELARKVGVSATYIGNLVRDFSPNTKSGKGRPAEPVVERIACVLNADVDDALVAAGYAPKNRPLKPPTNFAEFVEALEALGIEQFQRFDGPISDDLPPEEYEMLLEQIRAMVEIVARRRLPRVLDIEIEPQSDENVRTNRKTN